SRCSRTGRARSSLSRRSTGPRSRQRPGPRRRRRRRRRLNRMDESAFKPETLEELGWLASERAAALGRPVVAAAFAGSDRASVFDALEDEHGELVAEKMADVQLEHPSPSWSEKVERVFEHVLSKARRFRDGGDVGR